MSSKPQRSLRLEKRSARSLAILSGAPGEIFFDNDNGTLRVYTDTTGSSIILANRQWVADNTFSGDFNDLTNKPTIPTNNNQLANGAGYVTQAEVDAALANIDTGQIDLTGYATETYVDNAISNISNVGSLASLDGIGDVTYSGTPQTNEVLTWNGTNWVNSIGSVDLSSYYNSSETDTAISTAISNFQTTIIDAAPATLDTLNELAAALGDDANFATTVTTALSGKEPTITAGTTSQYWRGDKSWQTFDAAALGAEPVITAGTVSQYLRGDKTFQTLNATAVGLGNVTNESKATMFTNPTFTGTVSGVTATHVGLGNVTNESKATMFTSPTFTGTATAESFASTGTGAPVITSASTITLTATDKVIINGDLDVIGTTTLAQSTEVLNTKTGATGTVAHDFSTGAIWYHSNISSDFTANFTNVPTTDNRTISVVLILDQGATAYLPSSVQIDGATQPISWLGNAPQPGTANQLDFISFTFIRVGAGWSGVVGSISTYGAEA